MDEIEATPEMIAAGVLALTSCDLRVEGHEEVVQEVWAAMERVRLSQIVPITEQTTKIYWPGGGRPATVIVTPKER